ncbi:TIGR03854 family LLM class F420-dependent oxidoreductase [bacterium]|nr:TIGR03854 family LLM class F420-dependent oxidoreductase [bacterium]
MKIRIGYGLGTGSTTTDPLRFGELVDNLERLRFDSLWLSERVNGPALDPVVGMTFAIARTERLKVGASVMVLPGRNPVLLAKSMASLDRLSNGRLLPAFGLGIANGAEHQAFGVERKERAAWFNEAMPLLRRLWSEDSVTHHGERFHLDNASVNPKPIQEPLEVWMGGAAPLELRRVGRYSDGWLPSFSTPEDVKDGMEVVNGHAADAGREIDPEHFGVLVGYTNGEIPDRLVEFAKKRNPDRDVRDVIATRENLAERLEAYTEVGASKFVIVPLEEPSDWKAELEDMAERVLHLEN